MNMEGSAFLSNQQLLDYDGLGFIHSIPILSDEELRYFNKKIVDTCNALGGNVTRLDGLHLYFRWVWDLCIHPRLLDCMESLLGGDILLKSSRFFCKNGNSSSFVGWHQDGYTEGLTDTHTPAIWLGLTEATVKNGCLRVIPRSHRLGPLQHDSYPNQHNLTTNGVTACNVQLDDDLICDLVMRPGEMSLHHPLVLHGSCANRSSTPRIGLSATYTTPKSHESHTVVAWVRGGRIGQLGFEPLIERPKRNFEEAVTAYRNSGQQILFSKE